MQSQFSMAALAAVGAGGAAGSIARYVLGALVHRVDGRLPFGTLFVNVTGSFVLGLLLTWFVERTTSPELRLLLVVGVCGGYTTFSSFAYESAMLMQDGRMARLVLYVSLSVTMTITAVVAGLSVGRWLIR